MLLESRAKRPWGTVSYEVSHARKRPGVILEQQSKSPPDVCVSTPFTHTGVT